MIWVESPSNPLLKIVDLRAVSAFAKDHDLITVCDNTFCSPYIQKPIELGFDLVVHSATKYLNGHSDVVGGIRFVQGASRLSRASWLSVQFGWFNHEPFDSFLVLRSLKTLPVRMQRHCENAAELHRFLISCGRESSLLSWFARAS